MLGNRSAMAISASIPDEDLVARSLAGDHSAFGTIVSRYQSLVASIAYSATGSLSHSEDLAQETFIEAWRNLKTLHEPTRLSAWLCSIARNRTGDALRRLGRQPLLQTESLDVATGVHTPEPAPLEQAISAEEQALLWRALARIPSTYREPLVLYYREQQSIEAVSHALSLSEDATKQRLSRGRRLLQEQMQAFVENALARSAPSTAFTAGVLTAIPLASPTAAAAVVAAKSSTVAKATGLAALMSALFGPIVAFASGYFSVRAALDAARTVRERTAIMRQTRAFGIASVIYTILAFAYLASAPKWLPYAIWYAGIGQLLPLGFALWLARRVMLSIHEMRQVRAEERLRMPAVFSESHERALRLRPEFRSHWTLLGLPLVHVRYDTPAVEAAPARGWIAVGDRADGVLFAMGGVARGGIAVGGIAIGVVAVGGVAIAPLALGCVAFGALALGGAAYAWNAIGGFATGWRGAAGAMALSHDYAAGGLAIGAHANDDAVRAYFAQALPDPVIPLLFGLLVSLSVFPAVLFAWRARANLRPK
ncbi:MAG: RNA polymerase sigma factor [Lysobacteraceae bacterium]|nr:MAG: RNA polymerase sigma factor [Xanthomonadaceae bacterium]